MNKKYSFKIWALAAIMPLALSSCESFLDTTQRGVTSQEDFYQTDNEALQALYAIYDRFQQNAVDQFQYKNILSDDAQAGGGGRSDNSQGNELNEFDISTTNSILTNMYTKYYQMIYCANVLLKNVAEDTDVKRLCRAEAKCLRAMAYFELTTLWGPVPLVTEPLTAGNYNQPNSTIEALYAQMEEDLKEAIDVLPLKSQQSTMDKARCSKGTAQAMLGKVYLYQEKFADAATAFDAVINSHEYDLYPDYSQITRKVTEFGIESIFEISYQADLTEVLESTPITAYCGPRSGYFKPGTTGLNDTGWGFVNPEPGLREAFIAAGDDIRQKATVLNEEDMQAVGGTFMDADGNLAYGSDGLVRTKYGTYLDEIAESNNAYQTIGGTNYRLIRYADVLLMAAEAHNRKPSADDAKALGYINEVRARVQLPALSSTGNALFQDIKKERRLELAFEFVRYQDLVRWGDAATVLKDSGKRTNLGVRNSDGTYQYYENAKAGFKPETKGLMPIPEQEISVNPNINQNPGY